MTNFFSLIYAHFAAKRQKDLIKCLLKCLQRFFVVVPNAQEDPSRIDTEDGAVLDVVDHNNFTSVVGTTVASTIPFDDSTFVLEIVISTAKMSGSGKM